MDWKNVQHLFEWDGSWRDLYVFDTDIQVWQQLLSALCVNCYTLHYSEDGIPAPVPQQVELAFARREQVSVLLAIVVGSLNINCHFFVPEQIEFDIDPREVNGEEAFAALLGFMWFVGQSLGRRVTLTPENGEDETLLAYNPGKGEWERAKLV